MGNEYQHDVFSYPGLPVVQPARHWFGMLELCHRHLDQYTICMCDLLENHLAPQIFIGQAEIILIDQGKNGTEYDKGEHDDENHMIIATKANDL
jgi:hypothetical protein